MQFQEAVKTCFNKYADFKGRASRSEFWWFVLFNAIVNLVAGALSNNLGNVALIALLLPYLAVSVRRLHDIGKKWYWILLGLIPILGQLVLVYFYVQKSMPTANEFGNVPVGAEVSQTN
jgi:uncharacterized membrane protein YhaH (DUF805 family)